MRAVDYGMPWSIYRNTLGIIFASFGGGITEPKLPSRNCFGINLAIFLCVMVLRKDGYTP